MCVRKCNLYLYARYSKSIKINSLKLLPGAEKTNLTSDENWQKSGDWKKHLEKPKLLEMDPRIFNFFFNKVPSFGQTAVKEESIKGYKTGPAVLFPKFRNTLLPSSGSFYFELLETLELLLGCHQLQYYPNRHVLHGQKLHQTDLNITN